MIRGLRRRAVRSRDFSAARTHSPSPIQAPARPLRRPPRRPRPRRALRRPPRRPSTPAPGASAIHRSGAGVRQAQLPVDRARDDVAGAPQGRLRLRRSGGAGARGQAGQAHAGDPAEHCSVRVPAGPVRRRLQCAVGDRAARPARGRADVEGGSSRVRPLTFARSRSSRGPTPTRSHRPRWGCRRTPPGSARWGRRAGCGVPGDRVRAGRTSPSDLAWVGSRAGPRFATVAAMPEEDLETSELKEQIDQRLEEHEHAHGHDHGHGPGKPHRGRPGCATCRCRPR